MFIVSPSLTVLALIFRLVYRGNQRVIDIIDGCRVLIKDEAKSEA